MPYLSTPEITLIDPLNVETLRAIFEGANTIRKIAKRLKESKRDLPFPEYKKDVKYFKKIGFIFVNNGLYISEVGAVMLYAYNQQVMVNAWRNRATHLMDVFLERGDILVNADE